MKIHRIDHVGIVVDDLSAAKQFFLDLGLEVEGEQKVSGEWVDKVVGLKGVRSSIVMLRTPDGGTSIELSRFDEPLDEQGARPQPANALGIRHIALVVDDLDAIVLRLKKKGIELIGEAQTYEDAYKLCYIRGPEGIILELAERLSARRADSMSELN